MNDVELAEQEELAAEMPDDALVNSGEFAALLRFDHTAAYATKGRYITFQRIFAVGICFRIGDVRAFIGAQRVVGRVARARKTAWNLHRT